MLRRPRPGLPELVITCIMVLTTTAGAYGYAGPAAALAALTAWAVVILVLLRLLVPLGATGPDGPDETWQPPGQGGYIGFWRKRGMLVDASASMRSYDSELRPALQHLLAARLAERHDISLYADPAEARRVLLAGEPDDQLWFWLDPQRPAEQRATRRGIPPQMLATIVERLEQL